MLLRRLSVRFVVNHLHRNTSSSPGPSPPKAVLPSKKKGTIPRDSTFVDERTVRVVGGKGGDGCIGLLSVSGNEYAGPDGGDGGNGGHVLFEACISVKSLKDVPIQIKGRPGDNGSKENCHGKNAAPTIVKVPFGTIFRDETGKKLADLSSADECIYLGARGGAGGKGNKFFTSAENQAPEVAEYGAAGEEKKYFVEVSTMAHVGLVGYPNAGKSTLLQAISRARPKVAPYPFTTLKPHIGMVLYDDYEQVAVADIPGLIEQAHLNRGLGHAFLKHIQRCLCLIYVVDISQPDPWNTLQILYDELDHFDESLRQRPAIVLANKMDMKEAQENFAEFKRLVADGDDNLTLLPISAKHCLNLDPLLVQIRKFYDRESAILKEKYTRIQKQQRERLEAGGPEVQWWQKLKAKKIENEQEKLERQQQRLEKRKQSRSGRRRRQAAMAADDLD